MELVEAAGKRLFCQGSSKTRYDFSASPSATKLPERPAVWVAKERMPALEVARGRDLPFYCHGPKLLNQTQIDTTMKVDLMSITKEMHLVVQTKFMTRSSDLRLRASRVVLIILSY